MSGNKLPRLAAIAALLMALLSSLAQAAEPAASDVLAPYPSPEAMYNEINGLAVAHPDRAQIIEYGKSVQGRPLLAIFIHRPGASTDKPAAFIAGNIHGNEWIGNRHAMAVAHLLLEQDGKDQLVTSALDQMNFYIAPCLNPDGYQKTWENPHPKDVDELGLNRKNAHGVDLNRNFPLPGKRTIPIASAGSPKPESINYRGPQPLSEPETMAIDRFFAAHPQIIASVDWHAYGSILFPAHCPTAECTRQYKKMCKAFQDAQPNVKYIRLQNRFLDTYTGEMEDWLYAKYGVLATDVEIGNGSANKKACGCKDFFWLYNPKNMEFWDNNDARAAIAAVLKANEVLGGKPAMHK